MKSMAFPISKENAHEMVEQAMCCQKLCGQPLDAGDQHHLVMSAAIIGDIYSCHD
jgi:hypothetical protein